VHPCFTIHAGLVGIYWQQGKFPQNRADACQQLYNIFMGYVDPVSFTETLVSAYCWKFTALCSDLIQTHLNVNTT